MTTQLDRVMREVGRQESPGVNGSRPAAAATTQSVGPPADTFELTDAGNGQRFTARHGKDVQFVPELGWMVYTGTHWERGELKARALMLDTSRAIYHEAALETDRKVQKEIADWARKSQQASRLQGALWCAQPELADKAANYDSQDMRLNISNGAIDLRTAELGPHRRADKATRIAAVAFDASATCPTWTWFLESVLPDPTVRDFVQRFVGYSLTGLTVEQVVAFLYGSGRNGKSVFLETIADMLGDYSAPTRIETLSVSRGGGIPNDVAALAGPRIVSVSETNEGARFNESLLKDLSGGDKITARFLRHEYFQFRPKFKLWIRGNHKPQIRGTDDGIWRRMMLIPFTVQIPEQDVDPDLPGKLRAELPGILNWALRGCMDWQRDGLRPPAAVTDAVREYRSEMDTLGEFFDECCVIAPGFSAPAKKLYATYRDWCDDYGEHAVSQRRFGLALGERGFQKTKPKSIVWHGIGMLSDREPVNAGYPWRYS